MDNDDYEIEEPENIGGGRDEGFSHSALVMSAMRKCLELGSKEMRTGWFNTKTDRSGNQIQTYIEDTRKAFIESVKSLMMVMSCDFDNETKDNIDTCLEAIGDKNKELSDLNTKSWEALSEYDRVQYVKAGDRHIKGKITHKILINEMLEFELEVYRAIFSELTNLTSRKDFYKAEVGTY